MCTTLCSAADWAEAEFGGAELGDRRRSRRLIKVAAALAENPQGTIHASINAWDEQLAAYRLLARAETTAEAVTAPHRRHVREQCGEPGEYLNLEDTTTLDFTAHPATAGLGRVGDDDGRGLFVHSTLTVRIERWGADHEPEVTALGLLGQRVWARTRPTIGTGQEKRSRRLKRARESQRWAALYAPEGGPPNGARWTHVADRESDIYEVPALCRKHGVDWIVRTSQPRALADEDGSVFTAVAQAPVQGQLKVALRARPGSPRRVARLTVRARAVTVRGPWRPGGWLPPLTMNVVEAREADPPPGVEPIHWVLWTSWPIADFAAVCRVLRAYACRWLIEEYHKALKTGAKVEESQLMTAGGLMALTGILSIVAVRLLNLKLLAAVKGDEPLAPGELGPEALTLLALKFKRPKGGWTYRAALRNVAQLGGFSARKGDGSPGWQSLWRGWFKLMLMVEGFRLAQGT